MSRDGANWNVKYISNGSGRSYKISECSLKQANSFIGTRHALMKTCKNHLTLLYQRRASLLGEKEEEGKAKRKILQNLGYQPKEETNEDAKRMRQIILMALEYLENGADVGLVEALLKQARDIND